MKGCRTLCAARGEPLAGSAGTASAFVAVEWPKPLWAREKAELSARLPATLVERLARERARRGKIPLRLYQRTPGPLGARSELLFADSYHAWRVPDLPLDGLARALDDAFAGRRPEGAVPLDRQLLVCTDGQHDRCCAEVGRPLFRALTEAARPHGLAVAESSHLGGHRFAPTCLALPGRELYGRLCEDDALDLVTALRAGRVLARGLRGRLGQSELEQVARAALHARGSGLAEAPLRQVRESGDRARVTLAGAESAVEVFCARRIFRGPSSCSEAEDTPTPRWLATRIVS